MPGSYGLRAASNRFSTFSVARAERRRTEVATSTASRSVSETPLDTMHGILGWCGRSSTLPEAERERDKLPAGERHALYNAVAKLEAIGLGLGYPHTSAVQGADRLRELRPRAGRSPWRGLYRQVGQRFVIAAIGPEAQQDPKGFTQACRAATARLQELEE